VNIDVVFLLEQNPILLIFVVLSIGLAIGKIRFGSLQLGNSIGVLITSLIMGHLGFSFNADALTIGFMLFIYCVGIEAGPNFFGIFFRDGKHYLILSLVVLSTAIALTYFSSHYLGLGFGLSAGMMAGALTATPILVGAQDALNSGLAELPRNMDIGLIIENLSVGYAMAYLVGLISMIMFARLIPKLQKVNLHDSAEQIAQERGLGASGQRKVYLPIIRAYRVGQELISWTDGKNLRELGIYRQTGCYIERIRRTVFLPTLMVMQSCKKAMKSHWLVSLIATRVSTQASVMVKRFSTVIFSIFVSWKKRSSLRVTASQVSVCQT